ncbi:hypothetical protein [Falsiroseomonas oryzae]|uniref:hypothetical protein n=1 Tax=Falsiroseomonas oryzae TaxID=2766473 RepID=UPI0022EAAFF3|nr:hypothetical protein [Roseomonas sp. MO-31]
MTDESVERKKQLIRQLADELGIRIRELETSGTRGLRFRSPHHEALAATARKFADIMAGATGEVQARAADDLVEHYWHHHTNRTEKSEKGGSRSGMKVMVRCGHDAHRIYEQLQARVEYWQSVKNTSQPGETPADAAKRVALAERYTKVRNQSSKIHVGRPRKVIGAIEIKETSGGTNPDSITWEVGRMFLQHGDAVLADDVIDAILDNGGAIAATSAPSPALQDILARVQAAITSAALPPHEVKRLQKVLAVLAA